MLMYGFKCLVSIRYSKLWPYKFRISIKLLKRGYIYFFFNFVKKKCLFLNINDLIQIIPKSIVFNVASVSLSFVNGNCAIQCGTYCLMSWIASSYLIPLSIRAKATSTGALCVFLHRHIDLCIKKMFFKIVG